MSDELTPEQQNVLAGITETRAAARGRLADKLEANISDIDALAPLYPEGFTTDIQQIRNFLAVMITRLRATSPAIATPEQG